MEGAILGLACACAGMGMGLAVPLVTAIAFDWAIGRLIGRRVWHG